MERNGGEGDEWYGDGDGIKRWYDIVGNVILGTEPNDSLAYATGFKTHHLIMSMRVGH